MPMNITIDDPTGELAVSDLLPPFPFGKRSANHIHCFNLSLPRACARYDYIHRNK